MMATKPKQWQAVSSLLLGATLWGVIWYPMRLLEAQGISGLWLTLGIYTPPAVVMSAYLYVFRSYLRRFALPLGGIAIASWWTNTAFILAVLDGNVMRVLLLFYLSPIWTVLLGRLLLQERLTARSLWILLAALCGGLLMLVRVDASLVSVFSLADGLALSSGIAFAFHNVFVRKADAAPVTVKSECALLGVMIGSVGAISIMAVPMPAVPWSAYAGVFALGIFGMLLMTLLVQFGVSHMPVQRSAVILLFELVAGAVSQQIFTDEAMLVQEWVGGILIVAAAYFASRKG